MRALTLNEKFMDIYAWNSNGQVKITCNDLNYDSCSKILCEKKYENNAY